MIIAPSVLSFHYPDFPEEIEILNENAQWLHFDVMDGHFVPNLSFGPAVLSAFRQNSSLFMDVHLMVDDPDFFAPVFIKKGADGITFHYEVYNDIEKCRELVHKLKSYYIRAGISVKPNTPVEVLEPLLSEVDLVLIMSVEPGFGGQSFIPEMLDKVRWLKEYRERHDLHYLIEIDGGINEKTAHEAVDAGVDVLVAGSYVFNEDIADNIRKLKEMK